MGWRRIATAALVACCICTELLAEQRARVGRAYDANTGKLIYEEQHLESLVDGEVVSDDVRYVDPKGRTFATKRVYFGVHPYVPEFELANERTGHLEALRRLPAGALEVRYRDRAQDEAMVVQLATSDDALADAGFDRFVESNWEELLAGKHLVRRFLVPSRLEFMDFRIRRTNDDDPRSVSFAMEIDSALMRLLVPSITAAYDRKTRRLLRYEGPSNLRDNNGNNHAVRIEFEYIGQRARTGSKNGASGTISRFPPSTHHEARGRSLSSAWR